MVDADEVRALQIDPRLGKNRDDGFLGVQELFFLKDLRTVDERLRFRRRYASALSAVLEHDFRGFLYQDSEPGVRFVGNRDNNRWQYNLAWFHRLEKDLNSGLNDVTEAPRHEDILLFNLYRQDLPTTGFTLPAGHQFFTTTIATTASTALERLPRTPGCDRTGAVCAPTTWSISATTAMATSVD